MGLTRNVMVYRVVSTEAIEKQLLEVTARKVQLLSLEMDEDDTCGVGISAVGVTSLFEGCPRPSTPGTALDLTGIPR